MSLKHGIAAALAAGTIATVSITALTPKSVSEINNPDELGGHAQQITNDRLRQEGNAVGDSNYVRQFDPVEPDPVDPDLKLPIRLP